MILYSLTYSTYTPPCNIIFIMGVQPRNPFALDLDFGITNSDSREVQISQIDFGSEPP
jgi:hypothetical protein